LLIHCWWFSPDTPASSTTKTGRHDIADILLKMALKKQKQINPMTFVCHIERQEIIRSNGNTSTTMYSSI
jgi:hypothetical protein